MKSNSKTECRDNLSSDDDDETGMAIGVSF